MSHALPPRMKIFHEDRMRPSVHATADHIPCVTEAEHTAHMRIERSVANMRLESHDRTWEQKKTAFYAQCERETIARISQTAPAHMNRMLDGTLITCAIQPMNRVSLTSIFPMPVKA